MLVHCGERADELTLEYGNVVEAVGRHDPALAAPAAQPGRRPFLRRAGARSRTISSTLDDQGRGIVNILAADKLMASPQALRDLPAVAAERTVRACFPRSAIPTSRSSSSSSTRRICCSTTRRQALLEKVEQVVRLIRSKGVGVYFITQNPIDIPDKVAAQLGNRVQHKLNAFTPRDQQAVQVGRGHVPRQSGDRRRDRDHRAEGRRGAGLAAPARRSPDAGRSAR